MRPLGAIVPMLTVGFVPAFGNEMLVLTVGFAPGGTSSIAAEFIREALPKNSGYTVIIDNKPGAGGEIAGKLVRNARSRAFLFMSSTSTIQIPPGPDLVPVGLVARFDYVVVATATAPGTLAQYMQAAKDNPRLQNYGTAGPLTIAHLIGVQLFEEGGAPGLHVPYRGSREAIRDVVRGEIGMAIVPEPDILGQNLRVIARSGQGIVGGWLGVFASSATSPDEVHRVAGLLQAASAASTKLESIGLRGAWAPGAELDALHRSDYSHLSAVLDSLGLKR